MGPGVEFLGGRNWGKVHLCMLYVGVEGGVHGEGGGVVVGGCLSGLRTFLIWFLRGRDRGMDGGKWMVLVSL